MESAWGEEFEPRMDANEEVGAWVFENYRSLLFVPISASVGDLGGFGGKARVVLLLYTGPHFHRTGRRETEFSQTS